MMRGPAQPWRRATLIGVSLSLAFHLALLAILAALLKTFYPFAPQIAAIPLEAAIYQPEPPVRFEVPRPEPAPGPEGTPLEPAIIDQPATTPEPAPIAIPLVGGT